MVKLLTSGHKALILLGILTVLSVLCLSTLSRPVGESINHVSLSNYQSTANKDNQSQTEAVGDNSPGSLTVNASGIQVGSATDSISSPTQVPSSQPIAGSNQPTNPSGSGSATTTTPVSNLPIVCPGCPPQITSESVHICADHVCVSPPPTHCAPCGGIREVTPNVEIACPMLYCAEMN